MNTVRAHQMQPWPARSSARWCDKEQGQLCKAEAPGTTATHLLKECPHSVDPVGAWSCLRCCLIGSHWLTCSRLPMPLDFYARDNKIRIQEIACCK
jgi:hypothetical protein